MNQRAWKNIATFVATCFSFTASLAWKVGIQYCTSYMELACLFRRRGFVLETCTGEDITFCDLSFWLRRMFVYIDNFLRMASSQAALAYRLTCLKVALFCKGL